MPARAAHGPKDMDFVHGAGSGHDHDLHCTRFQAAREHPAGETLLVLGGLRCVGSAAVEISKAMVARVHAAASQRLRSLEVARPLGADTDPTTAKSAFKDARPGADQGPRRGCDLRSVSVGDLFWTPAVRSIKTGRAACCSAVLQRVVIPSPANPGAAFRRSVHRGVFLGSFAAREPHGQPGNFSSLFMPWSAKASSSAGVPLVTYKLDGVRRRFWKYEAHARAVGQSRWLKSATESQCPAPAKTLLAPRLGKSALQHCWTGSG